MEWTADVTAGDWIRERLEAEPWGASMHAFVPRGFPAYARIFHLPSVQWVEGGPMPTQDELRETPQDRWPEVHGAVTSWADVAAVFGTVLHGEAQWQRIVRAPLTIDDRGFAPPEDWQHVIGPDGRQYDAPEVGALDAAQLAAASLHLGAHTASPDDVYVGLWEGSAGLVGFYGETPARVTLTFDDDDPALAERHRAMLERSIHDPFNNVFRKPVWQPGVLSDEISRGARLHLPERNHIVFRGAIAEFADETWPETVPWAAGGTRWTETPNLIWPADRAWALVTEVDLDSTIIGGSADLIEALCADPAIEARPIREGASLAWDADEVNR